MKWTIFHFAPIWYLECFPSEKTTKSGVPVISWWEYYLCAKYCQSEVVSKRKRRRMRLLFILPLLALAEKRSYDGHQVCCVKLCPMIKIFARCSELGHLMTSRTLSWETFRWLPSHIIIIILTVAFTKPFYVFAHSNDTHYSVLWTSGRSQPLGRPPTSTFHQRDLLLSRCFFGGGLNFAIYLAGETIIQRIDIRFIWWPIHIAQ